MTKARILAPGVTATSRSGSYRRRKVFAHKKQGAAGKKTLKKVVKLEKPVTCHNWYPAEHVPKPVNSNKHNAKPARLRKTLRAGTVVILLAGRFRGKRCIFLKQLPSGLLLVTGPYKLNGVPLRRVNQAYVIATSTRLEGVDKVDVSKIDDTFFAKTKSDKKDTKDVSKKIGKAGSFMSQHKSKKKKKIKTERVTEQKRVDALILPILKINKKKYPYIRHYLNAKFSLTNNLKPHLIRF